MYAQVRKYHSIRGSHTAEQVCQEIERTAVPEFEQSPGFIGYYVVELSDGGLLTISVYQDQVGVEAGKKLSVLWNKTKSAGALPETPDEAFEGQVKVQHVGKKTVAA